MTQIKKKPKTHRIPDFASREEMAEWWDTHDASDYWDELKPVKVQVAKKLSEGIAVKGCPLKKQREQKPLDKKKK